MVTNFFKISKFLLLPILIGGALPGTLPFVALAETPRSNDEQRANRVYTKANPSVVTIRAGDALGSGFVVNRDGTIVTNAHVVQGAPSVVTVVFANGKEFPADVMGFAKNGLDLAILKINAGQAVPSLVLATPNSVRVGDQVYAIGTPLQESNSNTFTQGVVSRLDKKKGRIQHSAPINAGNSGGPLLNSLGQVIGINTSIELSPVLNREGQQVGVAKANNGIGFSITVDTIRSFIAAAGRRDLSAVSTLGMVSAADTEKQKSREIALNGQFVKGLLEPGDVQLEDGSWADAYTFSGEAGQTVIIELNSRELNTFLQLFQFITDDKGKVSPSKNAENDDAGPGTTNSRITFKLPATGAYLIVANSKAVGEKGQYQIRAIAR